MDTVWELDMGNGQTFEQGVLDASLNNAALYALLPIQAQAEGISVSPDLSQQVSDLMASMETQAGSAELLDHSLWYNALTPELYTTLFEVNDLNSQLQEKLYGEGSAGYPTDDQVLSYAKDQGYYRAKHILLKTVDTNSPLTDENGNPTGEYEPLDEATVAEKKALAEDLLAQLQAAGDKETLFDQLMAQYSEDTASDGSLAATWPLPDRWWLPLRRPPRPCPTARSAALWRASTATTSSSASPWTRQTSAAATSPSR